MFRFHYRPIKAEHDLSVRSPFSIAKTFKILRTLKLLFLTYLRWGTKDNVLSNITPENWSPPLLELDFGPEKAVDLNGDLFSGRNAYRLSLS